MHLPSELEAIAVIPALRSMLARELVNNGRMSQTQVASLLGVTQAAVSNYITGSRGKEARYLEDPAIMRAISELALNIDEKRDRMVVVRGLFDLTEFIRKNRLMCNIHGALDQGLDVDSCHICDD
ncbi:MAG: hypothetical protein KIY11_04450 [Thermoplasmata archaeon]|nr:hypothetical protein [Candidatus Sysuiplasma acidicola]